MDFLARSLGDSVENVLYVELASHPFNFKVEASVKTKRKFIRISRPAELESYVLRPGDAIREKLEENLSSMFRIINWRVGVRQNSSANPYFGTERAMESCCAVHRDRLMH